MRIKRICLLQICESEGNGRKTVYRSRLLRAIQLCKYQTSPVGHFRRFDGHIKASTSTALLLINIRQISRRHVLIIYAQKSTHVWKKGSTRRLEGMYKFLKPTVIFKCFCLWWINRSRALCERCDDPIRCPSISFFPELALPSFPLPFAPIHDQMNSQTQSFMGN